MAFGTPVVEHRLECEIAAWGHQNNDPPHHRFPSYSNMNWKPDPLQSLVLEHWLECEIAQCVHHERSI